jgi:hypothetical protein
LELGLIHHPINKALLRWDLVERFHLTMSVPFLNEYFTSQCPASAPFFSFMGAAIALVFASESSFLFSHFLMPE